MQTENIKLTKGAMQVYDFGAYQLHAYQTNDLLSDECFVLEGKNDLLLLEMPAFYSNHQEFINYVNSLSKPVVAKVISDHPNGIDRVFPDVPAYASQGTIDSMAGGTIKGLVMGFIGAFGDDFDGQLPVITNVLTEQKVILGEFELHITYHNDDIEIALPQFQSVYTHMLGHNVHSIVAGVAHADAMIAQLQAYLDQGYTLVLSSHYTPETLDDVRSKIAYLQDLKAIAAASNSADEFQQAVKAKYPNYLGDNYLEMTASNFFAN